ncbi:hypothetical protein M3Y96_00442300 [Aphelenchoides besseyi]|nr:hypothetical protein M3Y96_00442300 [Aphelenchoides besseyi]
MAFRGGRGGMQNEDSSGGTFRGAGRGGGGRGDTFDQRSQSNDYNSPANDGGGNSYRGGRGSSNDYDNRYNDGPPSHGGPGGFDYRPQSNDYNARSNVGGGNSYREGRGSSNDYDNGPPFRGGRRGYNDNGSRPGGYNFGGEMDRISRPSHIPVKRSVDEIFKEDEKHKRTKVFYSLDGQTVENGPEPPTVIEKWEEADSKNGHSSIR